MVSRRRPQGINLPLRRFVRHVVHNGPQVIDMRRGFAFLSRQPFALGEKLGTARNARRRRQTAAGRCIGYDETWPQHTPRKFGSGQICEVIPLQNRKMLKLQWLAFGATIAPSFRPGEMVQQLRAIGDERAKTRFPAADSVLPDPQPDIFHRTLGNYRSLKGGQLVRLNQRVVVPRQIEMDMLLQYRRHFQNLQIPR
jgi:hypothetical protein